MKMSKPLLLLILLLFCRNAWCDAAAFARQLAAAQQQLRAGQYSLALDELDSLQSLAATPLQQAQAHALLGESYYLMRRYAPAEEQLNQALALGAAASEEMQAGWRLVLANLAANRGNAAEAKKAYEKILSASGVNQLTRLGARLGLAALLPPANRLADLQNIALLVQQLPDALQRAGLCLHLANQAKDLGGDGLKFAYEHYQLARQYAGEQQPRLLAESLDGLAALYERQNRFDEARQLNSLAIRTAAPLEAHDLLLTLEWRQGRLLKCAQEPEQALAAYQRAVDHIEAVRHDIPVEYLDGRSSFRDTLEPVYLELADLLLKQANTETGAAKTALLRRAREAAELIKQSELEDFLGGRCAVQSNKNVLLDNVAPATAVIYPIMLPDRLELLVSSGTEIERFSQPVAAKALETQIKAFADSLRNGRTDVKNLAQQLYRNTFAPVETWLQARQVQTLVIAPDGAMRLIPLAALHDGTHYLLEKYAFATSPGLSLFAPPAGQSGDSKALLAGLSEPGPVVEHLPPKFLNAVQYGTERGAKPSRSIHLEALPSGGAERLVSAETLRLKLKNALKLPGVNREIGLLQEEMPNRVLLNESFTKAEFDRQIAAEPYNIIHIASHGVFGSSAETSFLMTYDDIIDMNDLERMLKAGQFAQQPLDLITLSACQTAEGDDRAPLGISGIAIKAHVRSALGSLWPVSDDAASQLMAEFYKNLRQPGVNKVQALRQAQLSLLKQEGLENPYYWSPFILVGNWL